MEGEGKKNEKYSCDRVFTDNIHPGAMDWHHRISLFLPPVGHFI